MNLLSIKNLSKMGREAPLFSDVTLGLDEGQKAALIGKNGAGKSTLLNCVAGLLAPDGGTVTFNKEAGFSYLAQTPAFDGDDTIRGHIFKSDSPKLKIINEYQSLCVNLGNMSPSQAERFSALEKKMNDGDLWNYEAQISSILSTLGIHDMERRMKTLSGGMAKKVALAQVLVEDTKILLLDEPTNHLDIKTISWLEDYLRSTSRAVFMVTHDRYFLDSVCSDIYELERGRLTLYHGNYSEYLEKKEYTLIDKSLVQIQESGLIFVGYRNKSIWKKGVREHTEHLSRVHRQPNRIYSIEGVHPTIPSQETSGRFWIYDEKNDIVRKLTLNECYKLMGFPDNFKRDTNKSNAYKQIGNSVVIPMICEIAKSIIEQGFSNGKNGEFSEKRNNLGSDNQRVQEEFDFCS